MKLDLDKLRELEKAATPGPFESDLDMFETDETGGEIEACVSNGSVSRLWRTETEIRSDAPDDGWARAAASQAVKDADYLAALLNAAPALLQSAAEREEMRRLISEKDATIADLTREIGFMLVAHRQDLRRVTAEAERAISECLRRDDEASRPSPLAPDAMGGERG